MASTKMAPIQAVRSISGLIEDGHALLTPAMRAALQELNSVVARRYREELERQKRDKK